MSEIKITITNSIYTNRHSNRRTGAHKLKVQIKTNVQTNVNQMSCSDRSVVSSTQVYEDVNLDKNLRYVYVYVENNYVWYVNYLLT
jgi:hypothetical protein